MMIEKKKKKKKIVVEQTPVFDHSLNSFEEAIGLPGIDDSIKKEMNSTSEENPKIDKLSKMVEIFYENFSKIELAVILSRSIGGLPKNEGKEEKEAQF